MGTLPLHILNVLKYLIRYFILHFYTIYFTFIVKRSILTNTSCRLTILPNIYTSQDQLTLSLDRTIIKSLLLPKSIHYENIQLHYHTPPNASWSIHIIPITGILFNYDKYTELLGGIIKFIAKYQLHSLPNNYDKASWIYNYITTHCTYSDDPTSNNPWSAFFEGKTQCYGYALLTQLLLSHLHVPNLLVGGKITHTHLNTSELHSWNLVRLGFRWYHLDTCFGSTSPTSLHGNYFLLGTEDLTSHDSWFTNWHLLPISKFSYARRANKKKKE